MSCGEKQPAVLLKMKAIPSFETSVSIEKDKQGNIQKTGTIDEKDVSFISVAAIYIYIYIQGYS